MGYTQYFYRNPVIEREVFNSLAQDTRKLLKNAAFRLTYVEGSKNHNGFKVTEEEINFNGYGDESCENIYFPIKFKENDIHTDFKEDGKIFSFCKTNRHPYDDYVVAFLILAKLHLQDQIKINSDGELEDWEKGRKLINKIFHYGVKFNKNQKINQAIISKSFKRIISEAEKEKNRKEFIKVLTNT